MWPQQKTVNADFPRGQVGSGPTHVGISALFSDCTLLGKPSFSLCDKRDDNSCLEELLRALEITDVKCLLRSGHSINGSDCLGLSLISSHSHNSTAGPWRGRLEKGASARRQDLPWAAPGTPPPHFWPSQHLSQPWP